MFIILDRCILLALWTTDPAKVIISGTQTTTTIEGLTPATSYHIRVIAENAIGSSESSDETQAITQEEGTNIIIINFNITLIVYILYYLNYLTVPHYLLYPSYP